MRVELCDWLMDGRRELEILVGQQTRGRAMRDNVGLRPSISLGTQVRTPARQKAPAVTCGQGKLVDCLVIEMY